MDMKKPADGCSYKSGTLPGKCAPLAMAYVPIQQGACPAYDPDEALRRGTLFPGLDLPWMNMVNSSDLDDTPLNELMSIDFVVKELALYMDTHPEDMEAFATFKDFLKLAKEARKRYVEKYGPVTHRDMVVMKNYSWIDNPWPWDYRSK